MLSTYEAFLKKLEQSKQSAKSPVGKMTEKTVPVDPSHTHSHKFPTHTQTNSTGRDTSDKDAGPISRKA